MSIWPTEAHRKKDLIDGGKFSKTAVLRALFRTIMKDMGLKPDSDGNTPVLLHWVVDGDTVVALFEYKKDAHGLEYRSRNVKSAVAYLNLYDCCQALAASPSPVKSYGDMVTGIRIGMELVRAQLESQRAEDLAVRGKLFVKTSTVPDGILDELRKIREFQNCSQNAAIAIWREAIGGGAPSRKAIMAKLKQVRANQSPPKRDQSPSNRDQ